MSGLIRASRSLWVPQVKPDGIPRIDWSHPLTKGLVSYWFDTGAGCYIDLVNRRMTAPTATGGSTVPARNATPWGAGFHFSATLTEQADPAVGVVQAWTAPYSVMVGFVVHGAPGATNAPCLFGLIDASGNGPAGVYFPAGTSTLGIGYGNGATPFSFSYSNEVFYVVVGAATGASAQSSWVNGAAQTAGTGTSAYSGSAMHYSFNANGAIYNSNSFPAFSNATVFFGADWIGRALTAAEATFLYQNPYCFLLPQESESMTLYAPATGLSFVPASVNRDLSFFLPTINLTTLKSFSPASSDAVLSKFTPAVTHTIAYLNPWVIDNGLGSLFSTATHIHICSGNPTVFEDVAGMSLGNSNPGAGNCFTTIDDATPNGRQIATVAVSGAAVGDNGTVVSWAITDQSAGRLLAVNNLATPLAVSSGGTFNLPSFKIVVPEVGTDVLVGDTGEIDIGMEEFALVNKIVVCSAQPTDYATANTLTLGTKDFGVGNAFGSIIDAGWCHTIVSIPVTDGDVTDDGTAAYWAVLDDANSRLVATGPLTPSTAVTTGQKFTLTDIAIDIPILALSLIAAPAVLEYFYYLGF